MHSIVSTFVLLLCVAEPDVAPTAKTPNASLCCIQVRQGLQVELIAAEPLVADPIAIAWGADGKLWVVEMRDYPSGGEKGTGGRISYLEDTDDDGKYDRSTVFLEDLDSPTGVMPWRKGVLVTCAPDIFYAEDTDSDGKADRREVLFTGFVEGNPQHRVNGLRYGLDNWIYCANGDNGGRIKSLKTGHEVDIHGHDFRIRPDEGLLDPQTGMSQFSRCRDDWGNWFGGNSAFPLWHCVLADRYLRRNRHVAAPDPYVEVMDPPLHAPVHPISPALPRLNEPHSANRFTSACGAAVYRDELFGPAFGRSYFVCEPAHNLVRCELMTDRGVTFASKADDEQSEFLASTDNWFRPVQVRTGPDGALWVVDMYRLVIEHPEFIPRHLHARLDFRAGTGKGRIYRALPVDKQPRKVPRLNRLNTADLVAALDSPNGPQRDMAQQLLVQRHDKSAIPLLEQLVAKSKRATCRLHALCTLDGLDAANNQVLRKVLLDPHPSVRRHAVRICESKLAKATKLQTTLLQLIDDPDPRVRLQLASSLGEWDDARAGRALSQIAVNDAQDRFIVAAVMSSATKYPGEVLAGALRQSDRTAEHAELIKDLLVMSLNSANETVCAFGLNQVAAAEHDSHDAWQLEVVAGLLDYLDRRNGSLRELAEESGGELRSAIHSLSRVFTSARRIAVDQKASCEIRASAARLLGRGLRKHDEDMETLATLLLLQSPAPLQEAAVAALGKLHRPDVLETLLDGWRQHSPRLRDQILDILVSRPGWMLQLLKQIESKRISPSAIGLRHRGPLIAHSSDRVRRRAAAVFDKAVDADRERVIRRYHVALDLTGKPKRGGVIFQKKCSACHQPPKTGHHTGPDLWALRDRSPQTLLVGILDPNRAVEPRYVSYSAVTTDGRILTGVLPSETGNAITLVDQQGKRHVLLRSELAELKSTGKSLMPDGLETEIPDPQDLADLLAYLSADRPPAQQGSGER